MSSDDSLDDSAAATTNAPDATAGVGAVSAVDVGDGVHFGEGVDFPPPMLTTLPPTPPTPPPNSIHNLSNEARCLNELIKQND